MKTGNPDHELWRYVARFGPHPWVMVIDTLTGRVVWQTITYNLRTAILKADALNADWIANNRPRPTLILANERQQNGHIKSTADV